MAAGGFRTFVAGETLDEDKINDFLMQGVLVFADSAARGSAITSPVHGQVSFLKDSDSVEFYNGTAWEQLASTQTVQYLVIGGGASGAEGNSGGPGGGGGGAGGYVAGTATTVPTAVAVPLIVGAGGAVAGNLMQEGNTGNASQFYTVVGLGGGFGSSQTVGRDGGSGGGGAFSLDPGGLSLWSQGNNGGAGGSNGSTLNSGGGGGAGAVGVSPGGATGSGAGGAGLASTITGSSVTRGGGGGGGVYSGTLANAGAGGSGGGGRGAYQNVAAVAGTANTGGGGGGGARTTAGLRIAAAAGGSGVVIIRVTTGTTVSFSGGVSQTSGTDGGDTYYIVTAAGPTDTVTIG